LPAKTIKQADVNDASAATTAELKIFSRARINSDDYASR
jgi:hypothetical protein